MKKRYPRKSRIKRFEGFFESQKDLITDSTIAVDNQIYPLILSVINSAKKTLCLAQFQFSLDKRYLVGIPFHLFSSLKSRKDDGVNVRILLNQKFANLAQLGLNRRAENLLTASGIPTRFTRGKRTLHSKIIIVDDECAIISSSNLTITSLCDNNEVAIFLKSNLVKDILLPWFNTLWESSV